MKTFQIAAVDDQIKDQNWLAETLADYMTQERLEYVLSVFSCGEEFIAALETRHFDIVFMDVYMKGMTGVETAHALRARDRDCKLVFLTSSEDYMRQGFSLNSAHYLIKPVKEDDFRQAMENCRVRRQVAVPFLPVLCGRQIIQVNTLELYYADIAGRTVTLHTARGPLNAGRSFSAAVEPLLTDRRFLMCNKALLVNMDYIASQNGDSFILKDGCRLPIAPRRKQDILAQYRNYIFDSMGGVR